MIDAILDSLFHRVSSPKIWLGNLALCGHMCHLQESKNISAQRVFSKAIKSILAEVQGLESKAFLLWINAALNKSGIANLRYEYLKC